MAPPLTSAFEDAPAVSTPRSRYISLLQIAGTLAIIGFHVDMRGASWGWTAVVLFFTLAGVNMATAVDRSESLFAYARARARRMAPELAIVWCIVAILAAYGSQTGGADWFLISSPLFLQNLTLPFFQYQLPDDWVFTPLWFLGALLQLQLVMYGFRTALVKNRPLVVVAVAVLFGTLFRWGASVALGGSAGELDKYSANVLYCLPFTHIEAITLGFLVGRGSLAGLGRQLPVVATGVGVVAVAGTVLSVWWEPVAHLGFVFPFRGNYMHIWGYSLLAFAAASLCSPANWLAMRVRTISLPPWIDFGLARLGALTFAAFAFHGIVLALGLNFATRLTRGDVPHAGPILFTVTVVETFVLAQIVLVALQAAEAVSMWLRTPASTPSFNPSAGWSARHLPSDSRSTDQG